MPRPLIDDSIETKLAHHKAELQRLIEELKTADAQEKAELRQEIETLKNHIETEKKAKEDKEKAEGTGGTLVLPPEQVPQGQHHGDKPGEEPAANGSNKDGSPRKGKGWKGVW